MPDKNSKSAERSTREQDKSMTDIIHFASSIKSAGASVHEAAEAFSQAASSFSNIEPPKEEIVEGAHKSIRVRKRAVKTSATNLEIAGAKKRLRIRRWSAPPTPPTPTEHPELYRTQNTSIDTAVDIEYDLYNGRGVVALRNIPPYNDMIFYIPREDLCGIGVLPRGERRPSMIDYLANADPAVPVVYRRRVAEIVLEGLDQSSLWAYAGCTRNQTATPQVNTVYIEAMRMYISTIYTSRSVSEVCINHHDTDDTSITPPLPHVVHRRVREIYTGLSQEQTTTVVEEICRQIMLIRIGAE